MVISRRTAGAHVEHIYAKLAYPTAPGQPVRDEARPDGERVARRWGKCPMCRWLRLFYGARNNCMEGDVATKMLVNLAAGLEDSERVTVAFLVGGAGLQKGQKVAMFLTQGGAVRLGLPGRAEEWRATDPRSWRGCLRSSPRAAANCWCARSASTPPGWNRRIRAERVAGGTTPMLEWVGDDDTNVFKTSARADLLGPAFANAVARRELAQVAEILCPDIEFRALSPRLNADHRRDPRHPAHLVSPGAGGRRRAGRTAPTSSTIATASDLPLRWGGAGGAVCHRAACLLHRAR